MALPAPQRGDDADQPAIGREAGEAPRRVAGTGDKTSRVDARGNRGGALGSQAVIADQLQTQTLTRGNYVPRRSAIEPARRQIRRYRSGNMPGAHDRRGPGQGRACERREPAVGRAVSIDHVHRVSLQPPAQREETSRAFPRDRERHGVQTPFERRLENRRLVRRRDRHAVAPPRDPFGFVEDPDLLPAPSQGRFRVEDTHARGDPRPRLVRVRHVRDSFRRSGSSASPPRKTRTGLAA